MINKGEFYDTLSAVISMSETTHGVKPAAIVLGPEEYEQYELEIGGHMIMARKINATKQAIMGVPILLTPTPGIDFAFPLGMKDKLMEHLVMLKAEQKEA